MTDDRITLELTGTMADQRRLGQHLVDEGLDVEITTRMLESRSVEAMVGLAVFSISCNLGADALKAGVLRAVAKLRKEAPAAQVVGPDDLLPHRHAEHKR